MNILITGGAGFVGSNLAIYFRQKGHYVTVMDNLVRRGSELNLNEFQDWGIDFIHGDVRNKEDFEHLKYKPEIILDTAAQPAACTGYDNPTFDITNNYLGLLNVLEYARDCKAGLIFWSTNKVYDGNLVNALSVREGKTRWNTSMDWRGFGESTSIDGGCHSIYGLSKVCADLTCQEWAKSFKMPVIINRWSCLAGERQFGKSEQGWVAWFVMAGIFNLPVNLYGWQGKQVRDVLFIKDICELIEKQIAHIHEPGLCGQVFNVGGGMGNNVSLLECISQIENILGKKIKSHYVDEVRKADQCVYISDITKVRNTFNWMPQVKMEEGLIQIIDWVEKNADKLQRLYKHPTS